MRTCAAVYKGKIDFSSLARRVSKLSSIANQVNATVWMLDALNAYMSFSLRFDAFY